MRFPNVVDASVGSSNHYASVFVPSAYANAGPRLIDNGYAAIPIMPGTKRPGDYKGRKWWGTSGWQRFCDRLPTEIESNIWEKWPDAGVCVALDHRLMLYGQ